MNCRFCDNKLSNIFVDLGSTPPSNSYLKKDQLNEPELYYPLKLFVCENCFLVQVDEHKKASEIFKSDYAYFSSYSSSWLIHCQSYVNKMIERFGFNSSSLIVEIASNDGYLLQYFNEKKIPVLGIEPTKGTANVAIEKGIETIIDFFGKEFSESLISKKGKADLIIGNNVLAHVPDLNDFVSGLRNLLKADGVITMEFPHIMQLINNSQFDTIYHEHFSYFSFYTVKSVLEQHRLQIFDVEELNTHGGSLRIYAKHVKDNSKKICPEIENLLIKEKENLLHEITGYKNFQEKVNEIKINLLDFLVEQKQNKKKVIGYGAAAKGNTLLNYCGIRKEMLSFIVDKSPHKQGKYMPASHIPIVSEEEISRFKPDFVLILPWNIKEEIIEQLNYIREWGGKFVVAIPFLKII